MGSWGFVIAALVFLAGWMLGNRGGGFDPYPFILLNLVLSCLAADQISSQLARHDYETNLDAMNDIKAILVLTSDIHRQTVQPVVPPSSQA